MVVGIRGDECCLFSIFSGQGNLVIALKCVQETHPRVSIRGIHQLIDLQHRKWVLWACSVQVREIYANFPFFFFTTTVLASHFGKKISLIAPASFNLLISSLTALTCSLADLLGFYFLGRNDGSTLSLWTMNSGSTLGTSYGLQTNTSTFCIRNSSIFTLSSSFIFTHTWKYLSTSGNIFILTNSSA